MLMTRTHYQCASPKCKATDYTDAFPNDSNPPVINCWKCGLGRNNSTDDQIRHTRGMFPFKHEQYDTHARPEELAPILV
jgi:hypothetical protein